ncbi:hypothetical protein BGZ99_004810 [Dissophora globulifera]|uniref:Alginate lyase domain-containing protein n=1 Tax=Dissophora globulifera TaxID=979702 RepID=A0A9P6UUN8_9FUNG|nr:hypothetical protein BGZ99_004810 [Dissophora globulifera]
MGYMRGSSKRTLTILVALCIFAFIFSYTPYPNTALDQLPDYGWRATTGQEQSLGDSPAANQKNTEAERQRLEQEQYDRILQQQEENQREEAREEALDEQTIKDEKSQIQKDINTVNDDKVLVDKPLDSNSHEDKDEEDEEENTGPKDGLPVEFNESLFPITSQKLLESKIDAKTLEAYLHGKPQAIQARDASLTYILIQANNAYRNTSVYSVVLKPKSKIPPSGDIHDYSSLARYFWKNPKTESGLPYVRLDGHPNPDMDTVWDYRLLRKMFRDCYYMGMAYFWTGEERYAEKIVYRLKEWFLDRETYMNPNVKYGSLIFGNELGRAQGFLDMFKVYGMFDGLKAIEGSKALRAEPTLIPELQKWFTQYLEWTDQSIQANQERNARNNHGTYYSVQYVSILEFLGRNDEAKAHLEDAMQKRIGSQIRQDGAQPHETIRPISYFYSTFNLQGMILLAMQGDSHGLDLWRHKGPVEKGVIRVNSRLSVDIETGGGDMEDAIRYLADFGVRDVSEWPYPDSGSRNLNDVLKMAKLASVVYGQDRWQEQIENLEAKVDEQIPGEGASEGGDGGAEAGGEGASSKAPIAEDPNSFICALGKLSNGQLWHCYK